MQDKVQAQQRYQTIIHTSNVAWVAYPEQGCRVVLIKTGCLCASTFEFSLSQSFTYQCPQALTALVAQCPLKAEAVRVLLT